MDRIDKTGIFIAVLLAFMWFFVAAAGQIMNPTGAQVEGSLMVGAFFGVIFWAPAKMIWWIIKG